MKKHIKSVLTGGLLVATLFTGFYVSANVGKSGAWRSMQCNCIYPNSNKYGVIVDENPQGTSQDCVPSNCWIGLDL